MTFRTATTSAHWRFDITRNCSLTGTKLSGLRATLSEAANTWYAIYAVKSDDGEWVSVGDTVLPLRANYATLNSNFGTNGWVYLGMIRNGDGGSTTGDILNFVQHGNVTYFMNLGTGHNVTNVTGIILATTASASSLGWTYSAGTSGAVVPNNCSIGMFRTSFNNIATSFSVSSVADSGNHIFVRWTSTTTSKNTLTQWIPSTLGISIAVGSAGGMDISLEAFVDNVLGVGMNPVIQ